MTKELVPPKFGLSKNMVVAVQQMERTEGGLSTVEARALVDMCEFAGAGKVKLYEQTEQVTIQKARYDLRNL